MAGARHFWSQLVEAAWMGERFKESVKEVHLPCDTRNARSVKYWLECIAKLSALISKCQTLSHAALPQQEPLLSDGGDDSALRAVSYHDWEYQAHESVILKWLHLRNVTLPRRQKLDQRNGEGEDGYSQAHRNQSLRHADDQVLALLERALFGDSLFLRIRFLLERVSSVRLIALSRH